ncbi:HTH domain-containing protein [Clostridioides difficile]|nr:HTH domain-containing protein [Clostridioides difficile]
MSKIENVIKIILLLRKNENLKSSEISKKIGILERQVKEYICQLRKAGVDIKSKPGIKGGYCIEECSFCIR